MDNQIHPAKISLANRRQIDLIISISMTCKPQKLVSAIISIPQSNCLFLHFAFSEPFAPLCRVSLSFARCKRAESDDPITRVALGLYWEGEGGAINPVTHNLCQLLSL